MATCPLTYEHVDNSEFLGFCMKETLRLFPPIVSVMRQCLKPMSYKGFKIEAGDLICASPSTNHRLPTLWTEPTKFKPTRYEGPNAEDKVNFKHIAFGGGHHGCIGEKYAYLQIKSIISIILREYELELDGEFPEPNYGALIVAPQVRGRSGYVKYKRRVLS